MEWKDYQRTFFNFIKSMNQTKIVSFIAQETLSDFPVNVPRKFTAKTFENLKIFNDYAKNFDIDYSSSSEKARNVISFPIKKDDITSPIFLVYLANVFLDEDNEKIDYEQLCKYQELVMYYFHFDTFLGDSIRAICYQNPNVLKSSKNMSWEKIIEHGTFEKILSDIIDKSVYDFGWDSILKRIQYFNKEYKLDILIKEEDIMKKIEIMRNIIAHNGGKINKDNINLFEKHEISDDNYIIINEDFLTNILREFPFIGGDIFLKISEKFYGEKYSDVVRGVPTRGGTRDNDMVIIERKSEEEL